MFAFAMGEFVTGHVGRLAEGQLEQGAVGPRPRSEVRPRQGGHTYITSFESAAWILALEGLLAGVSTRVCF